MVVQGMPEFVFANRSGLEMFEATSSSLQELDWEKTLLENDRKLSYATFTQVLQEVRVCAGSGSCGQSRMVSWLW